MEIGEVSLQTNDVVSLANFYKKLFHIDNKSDDSVHQVLIDRGTELTVYNDGSPKQRGGCNISLAFTVEDVDTEYQRLLDMDVTVLEKPVTRPWGAHNMHFLDPDGNHVYFRSFPEKT